MQKSSAPAEEHRRKILFLCTGNTCRSPMAEGLFNQLLEQEGLADTFVAISAGLGAFDGEHANEKAAAVLQRQGVDLSGHRSQRMNLQLLGEAELIVSMAKVHDDVMARYLDETKPHMLLGSGIPDPYGKDEAAYEACARQITAALEPVLQWVKAHRS